MIGLNMQNELLIPAWALILMFLFIIGVPLSIMLFGAYKADKEYKKYINRTWYDQDDSHDY